MSIPIGRQNPAELVDIEYVSTIAKLWTAVALNVTVPYMGRYALMG
jgi:hypothetical protein